MIVVGNTLMNEKGVEFAMPASTIFCTDRAHPIFRLLQSWCDTHDCELVSDHSKLRGGQHLFLISCAHYLKEEVRNRYEKVWVIHESDLPKGRGWSPLAWQILEGKNDITVSIFEAADGVDTGPVLTKEVLHLNGDELYDEIQEKLFQVKLRLMDCAISEPWRILQEQSGEPSNYRKRTPEDSRLYPERTIAEQFNLLRICEPRFPAFFDFRGNRYRVNVRKM